MRCARTCTVIAAAAAVAALSASSASADISLFWQQVPITAPRGPPSHRQQKKDTQHGSHDIPDQEFER